MSQFCSLPGHRHAPAPTRRGVTAGLFALCFCCAGGRRLRAADGISLPVSEIAPGVFVHQGVHEEASAANLGGIANLGFVIGRDGVAVIDSGGCFDDGAALLASIRHVTDRPVTHVINTHFHPDHILGNGAFAGAEVAGHQNMPAALRERGAYYLDVLKRDLGAAAQGTTIVRPTRLVLAGAPEMIDLGDRILRLEAHPTAHTDCDLTIRDLATDTWFMGDLLFMRRTPAIDGSLKGWIAVLDMLRRQTAARVVPGHGPASADWPAAMEAEYAYLTGIVKTVRAAQAAGKSLSDTVAEATAAPAGNWLLFDALHPRNITTAYAEMEWE